LCAPIRGLSWETCPRRRSPPLPRILANGLQITADLRQWPQRGAAFVGCHRSGGSARPVPVQLWLDVISKAAGASDTCNLSNACVSWRTGSQLKSASLPDPRFSAPGRRWRWLATRPGHLHSTRLIPPWVAVQRAPSCTCLAGCQAAYVGTSRIALGNRPRIGLESSSGGIADFCTIYLPSVRRR
jgi:hypothetical protein